MTDPDEEECCNQGVLEAAGHLFLENGLPTTEQLGESFKSSKEDDITDADAGPRCLHFLHEEGPPEGV